MGKNYKTLRLILGDQLNGNHSWYESTDDSVLYVLMEVRQETDYVMHHIQKICGFFAAMRAFVDELKERGHDVEYIKLDDDSNAHSIPDNLSRLIDRHGIDRFEYQLPDEHRLDKQLANFAKSLDIESEAFDSEHFLTARHDVKVFFEGKKEYRLESFYRHMRRKHGILMDGDQPEGGKWNFDELNRKKYDGKIPIPDGKQLANDVTDIHRMLSDSGVKTFGEIDPENFMWPVDRSQAEETLAYFLRYMLPHFGTYQDAMTTEHEFLFHSRLSFALNTKMLDPLTVIEKSVQSWSRRKDDIALQQVEGFVRQILGWREYVRGIYWAFMPDYATKNYFRHKAKLPSYYWDGKTKMNCMRHAIGQSLTHAYAHHIQRLMITGNFALLAGIDPDEVDAWYLGVYIDAIEWVEIVNTRGMSQFADGGITASKPYVSTANYIDKMSDYCKGCYYDRKQKYGDRACPFNSLHWDFYERHRKQLGDNPRIGMMYRSWDRMKDEEKKKILKQARAYRRDLNSL